MSAAAIIARSLDSGAGKVLLIERGVAGADLPPANMRPDIELAIAACNFLNGRPDRETARRRLRRAVDALAVSEAGGAVELRIAAEMALRSRADASRRIAFDILERQLKQFCEDLRQADRDQVIGGVEPPAPAAEAPIE